MIYVRMGDPCTIVRLATRKDHASKGRLKKLDAEDLEKGYACIIRFEDGVEQYAVCQFLRADDGWQEIWDRMAELGAAFTKEGVKA